jgi:hypothetical protein
MLHILDLTSWAQCQNILAKLRFAVSASFSRAAFSSFQATVLSQAHQYNRISRRQCRLCHGHTFLLMILWRGIADGYSYNKIMDDLGLPPRSFYRYLSQTYEHDRRLLQEQNKDMLAFEISILHERLTNT